MQPYGTVLEDTEVISKLKGDLVANRTDIAERNLYINMRDDFLYGDGLWSGLNIPDGFDRTFYNYLLRITEIHTSQLMGQEFSMYSHYETQDMSQMDPKADAAEIKQTDIQNRIVETKAVARQQAISAIIRDNGGHKLFIDGARTGSDYGSTLYQMWWDEDEKRIKLCCLESIQNWFPIWSDSNFRERIGDTYVWQISVEKANVEYGSFLKDNASWPTSNAGDPLINIQGSSSALTNAPGETVSSATTRRPMVTQMDYTGYMANVAYDKKGNFVSCASGKETKLSFKVVGDIIVSKITVERNMPRFYYIPNKSVPRRPYGESDLPKSALDINQTILQLKSDQVTLANKELFPMLKGKNYENASLPKRRPRETGFIPMQADQDVQVLELPVGNLQAYEAIIQDRINDLLTVTAVPRELFFNSSTGAASQPAFLSAMTPMINIVETKQANWAPVLRQMFQDALELAAEYDKNLAAAVDKNENTWLYTRWPNVLRKEDPAHQSMLINDLHAGVKSVRTYMEERGYLNPDQEIDRIGEDLKDKVRSAILGGKLGELAQFTIFEKLGIPLYGFNQPKITLKGDLTPNQEGNLADNQGFDGGKYPGGVGPQGLAGTRADENAIDGGTVQYPGGVDPYAKYGVPVGGPALPQPAQPGVDAAQPGAQAPQVAAPPAPMPSAANGAPTPGAPAAPIITPGQNTPGAAPMSMPGTGATSASSVGQVKHTHQNRGK